MRGICGKKLGQLYLITDAVPVGVFSMEENVLGDLYIHPDYQRKGYGTRAIRFALHKFPQLQLTVLSNNIGAIRLYEKWVSVLQGATFLCAMAWLNGK